LRDGPQNLRLEPWLLEHIEGHAGSDHTVGTGLGMYCWGGLDHRECEGTEYEYEYQYDP
jgi:hypothetical protein